MKKLYPRSWLLVILLIPVFLLFVVFYYFSANVAARPSVFTSSLSGSIELPLPAEETVLAENVSYNQPETVAALQPKIKQYSQQEIDDVIKKIDELKKQLADLEAAEKSKTEEEKNVVETAKAPLELLPATPAITTIIPVYLQVLISEVQIAGTGDAKQEFVELYNPNAGDVDLTDWYIQRKSASGKSFLIYATASLFEGKEIPAHGYFVIARKGYFPGTQDIEVDNSLTEDNALFLKNPEGDVIDKVGWGRSADFSGVPAKNPPAGQSIGRTFDGTQEADSGNNVLDFVINVPTPKTQNIVYVPPVSTVNAQPGTPPAVFDNQPVVPAEPIASLGSTVSPSDQASIIIDNPPAPIDPVAPAPQPPIIISEIAWMGDAASANHEWIELFNPADETVDLSGWRLVAADGSPVVILSGSIAARGFYLLERTDDNSAPGATADLIYTGALGNTGEHLFLYDAGNIVQNKIDCSAGWLAGDNTTKQTMEKSSDGTWKNSQSPGGTPRS
ncbi:lamin tail domain-containing protein [Candidatus Parcubacteria bacterium]|nr:lamin tail domain-containing protein [Candidatus Parcubacteria bacterium]